MNSIRNNKEIKAWADALVNAKENVKYTFSHAPADLQTCGASSYGEDTVHLYDWPDLRALSEALEVDIETEHRTGVQTSLNVCQFIMYRGYKFFILTEEE